MKKKLHLQKEVVSVLDKKQMNYLTKGGGAPQTSPFICKTIPPQCDVIKTNLQNCGIEKTLACLTNKLCDTKNCIDPQTDAGYCVDPQTEVGCGGGENTLGCNTLDCTTPITGHTCETLNKDCMVTTEC